jgi:RluA family pseudouridine synthase
MQPEIIFEDAQLIVMNKPAGIAVEADRFGHPGVQGWVAAYFDGRKMPSNTIIGIVHRIDRPVSGVVMMAKKKSVLVHLNEQFAAGTVRKVYYAGVEGTPPSPEGKLEHFLMKDPEQKRAVIIPKKGKRGAAVSLSYKTLHTDKGITLLEVRPHTGKYHQIRAQLSAMSCPIVGDSLYGSKKSFLQDAILLHAASLTCIHPATNEEVTFSAPIPSSWPIILPE